MTPSLLRFAGIAAATVATACAIGYAPTRGLAGTAGVASMAIAAGVVLATAILGYLPVALRVLGPSVLAQAQSLLVGMGVRMFLTLGVLLASWNGDWLPHRAAFLAWIGLLYAVVLTIETVLVSRGLRPGPESVEERPPSPAPSSSMAGVSVATVSVPTLLGRSASA